MNEGRARRILEGRATRLARLRDVDDESRSEVELLTFESAGQLFAIRLDQVEGIARLTGLTPLPGAPAYILGLVRVRGRFVTLFEPRELFLPDRPGLTDATKVIAARDGDRVVALAAGDVRDVVSISRKEMDAARVSADGLTRAISTGNDDIAVLDVAVLLKDARLVTAAAPRRSVE